MRSDYVCTTCVFRVVGRGTVLPLLLPSGWGEEKRREKKSVTHFFSFRSRSRHI